MEIAGLIAIYSTLVLLFLTLLGGSLVLVSKWLLDNSLDPDAHKTLYNREVGARPGSSTASSPLWPPRALRPGR